MNRRAVVWSVTLEPHENEALESALSAHGLEPNLDGFEKFIRLVLSGELDGQEMSNPRLNGLESLIRDHGPSILDAALRNMSRVLSGVKK